MHTKYIVCILAFQILLFQKHIETKALLRKFGILSNKSFKVYEDLLENELGAFSRNIDLIKQRELNLQIEIKRHKIYQEYLLSRVTGSIFKDFFGRI